MGSWRLPSPVVQRSLFYEQQNQTSEGGEDDKDEEEECSLMGAVPIGEAIHGK